MTNAAVVYLHGFQSSPQSLKARYVQAYATTHLALDFYCPALPDLPDQAITFIDQLLAHLPHDKIFLFGSSLGGFYATYFAEKYQCKTILINPAVAAPTLLTHYLGHQENPYTKNCYILTDAHIDDLKQIALPAPQTPDRYWLFLQMEDDVLDARQASQFFYSCRCLIEARGNHHFHNFHHYLPAIFAWLTAE